MLGKSNFAVACLLAGTTSALLNTDKINEYQRHITEDRYHNGEENQSGVTMQMTPESIIMTVPRKSAGKSSPAPSSKP